MSAPVKPTESSSRQDINADTHKGRCSGALKYIILVIFVPAFLNHAALYREAIGLRPPARQKYLMCKPGHLSSAVDEYFFANESLSQMRTLSKFKRFNPGNIAISVLTSKSYSKRPGSDLLNKEWLSTKQQIEQFFSPGIENVPLPGSADVALFENSKTIANVIVKHINKWRKGTSHDNSKPMSM
ncbi:hypothetical protein QZH41_008163 [Actinostola sp. cb2023]|nr:hypothetical protein QZH41_008163 [Actinostola sp. cb2023]